MRVVIIGTGQAGAAVAARLVSRSDRKLHITMIGHEASLPYQRPPLSKAYLMGEMSVGRLWLRPPEFWDEKGVEIRLGESVTGIDSAQKIITLGKVSTLNYDALVLTTGSAPRHLPSAIGGNLPGVYVMRNLADVDMMRAEFTPNRRLVVIGGGYIGLETAAVAAKLGLNVTVIEAAPRILQRVASAETADYIRSLHQRHGVKIIEGVGLKKLAGDTRVDAVHLVDERKIAANFVITGIGVTPNTQLAESGGVHINNGIATDAMGATSLPDIWAAGDCASFPWKGERIRLESVGNAIDQAEVVADNILGARREYHATPWFWSDQYDCKLQIAGLSQGYDCVVSRKEPGIQNASFWYFKGTELLAVDALNDPRAYMVAKRLIEAGRNPDARVVSDPHTDLKTLLKT